MMRHTLSGLMISCVLALPAQAARIVITDTVFNDAEHQSGYVDGGDLGFFEIDISDAAVRRGSFSIHSLSGAGFPIPAIGDVADFLFAVTPAGERAASDVLFSGYTISLHFSETGKVTQSFADVFGLLSGITIRGTDEVFGDFGADNSRCGGPPNDCFVSGRLIVTDFVPAGAVPEPASFAVLGIGLVGGLMARRRAAL